MLTSPILTVAVLSCSGVWTVEAQEAPARKSADAPPAIKQLPNPFVFLDGTSVQNREDWQRRRRELKGLFEDHKTMNMVTFHSAGRARRQGRLS
jgi:hypothetical protein